MMFLELFVPRGAFSGEELRELAGRLTMRQLRGADQDRGQGGQRDHDGDRAVRQYAASR